jgi:DNA-directed RNA polymerase specialized sigma24 family protein
VNAKLDGEFREFMHARWPVMVRLAYGLTVDQGHAEDVAQAAFARAYASWPRVSRAGDPDAYVRQIVVNENRNRFRRRRVTERLTGSPPESGLADGAWTDTTRHRQRVAVAAGAAAVVAMSWTSPASLWPQHRTCAGSARSAGASAVDRRTQSDALRRRPWYASRLCRSIARILAVTAG